MTSYSQEQAAMLLNPAAFDALSGSNVPGTANYNPRARDAIVQAIMAQQAGGGGGLQRPMYGPPGGFGGGGGGQIDPTAVLRPSAPDTVPSQQLQRLRDAGGFGEPLPPRVGGGPQWIPAPGTQAGGYWSNGSNPYNGGTFFFGGEGSGDPEATGFGNGSSGVAVGNAASAAATHGFSDPGSALGTQSATGNFGTAIGVPGAPFGYDTGFGGRGDIAGGLFGGPAVAGYGNIGLMSTTSPDVVAGGFPVDTTAGGARAIGTPGTAGYGQGGGITGPGGGGITGPGGSGFAGFGDTGGMGFSAGGDVGMGGPGTGAIAGGIGAVGYGQGGPEGGGAWGGGTSEGGGAGLTGAGAAGDVGGTSGVAGGEGVGGATGFGGGDAGEGGY